MGSSVVIRITVGTTDSRLADYKRVDTENLVIQSGQAEDYKPRKVEWSHNYGGVGFASDQSTSSAQALEKKT